MAEKRSTYVFERESDYEEAKNHLRNDMWSDYNNSDCIRFEGYYGGEYFIEIYSECSNAPLVADIIREHRGKYRPS